MTSTIDNNSFDYTSGEIWTRNQFGYGIYEIRCKIPKGKGLWPAFWVYGDPDMNEIDFFEIYGDNVYEFNSNVHRDAHQDSAPEGCHEGHWTSNLTDWHVFKFIYEKDEITWIIDGNVKRVLYKHKFYGNQNPLSCYDNIHSWAFQESEPYPDGETEMNMILNMSIRSGDNAPNNNTQFPAVFEIDYVRYFRKREKSICACNYNLITYEQISNLPSKTHAIYKIETKENVNVNSGQNVSFNSDLIIINSGLTVQNGAEFSAFPSPCYKSTKVDEGITILDNNLLNNSFLIPCVNPEFTINVSNAQFYKVTIFKYIFNVPIIISTWESMISSNLLTIMNANNLFPGNYKVQLELVNCFQTLKKQFDVYIPDIECINVSTDDKLSNKILNNSSVDSNQLDYLSADNQNLNKEILIYPVPADNLIFINSNPSVEKINHVIIYDDFGRIAMNRYYENINQNEEINISQLEIGIYYVFCISDLKTEIKKNCCFLKN